MEILEHAGNSRAKAGLSLADLISLFAQLNSIHTLLFNCRCSEITMSTPFSTSIISAFAGLVPLPEAMLHAPLQSRELESALR